MPVIFAAAAVSAIMQYYNSEKARGADQARLNQIQSMFDNIKPPGYDVHVWDDPKVVANIPPPAFNNAKISPEDYKSVGQFIPQVAQFVKETNPQLVQATQAGQQGQQAQLDALQRYRQIAQGGVDPELAANMQKASDQARQDAQGRIASTLQAANRRGQADSGTTLAAQMEGGSEAMQRGAMMSQQAAAESYRNRLNALNQSANLGGQIRQGDLNQQSQNAGIINDFNQRTSREFQQYLQQQASMANQAQIQNLQNKQSIANANVGQQNDAAWQNQANQNKLAAQTWNIQDQNRQNNINVEKYKNQLQTQQFGNQMDMAKARAGISNQQSQMNDLGTRQTNQSIQGLGDMVERGAMYNDYMNRRYPQNDPGTYGGTGQATASGTANYSQSGNGYPDWAQNQSQAPGQSSYKYQYGYDDYNGGQ